MRLFWSDARGLRRKHPATREKWAPGCLEWGKTIACERSGEGFARMASSGLLRSCRARWAVGILCVNNTVIRVCRHTKQDPEGRDVLPEEPHPLIYAGAIALVATVGLTGPAMTGTPSENFKFKCDSAYGQLRAATWPSLSGPARHFSTACCASFLSRPRPEVWSHPQGRLSFL